MFSFAEEQKVEFPEKGLFLIRGLVDGDEERSAGSGKTSLLEAISWANFDKIGKNLSKDDLCRVGKTWCTVRLVYNNGLEIIRNRGRQPLVRVDMDGVTVARKTDEARKEIPGLLGMSYDLFVNAIYYPQDSINKMVVGTETDRQALAGEILEFGKFEQAFEFTKGKLIEANNVLFGLEGRLTEARRIEQIRRTNTSEIKSDLAAMEKRLAEITEVDDSEELAREEDTNRIRAVVNSQMISLEDQEATAQSEQNEAMEALNGDQCPTCLQLVTEKVRDDVKSGLARKVQALKKKLAVVREEYETSKREWDEAREALKQINGKKMRVEDEIRGLRQRAERAKSFLQGMAVTGEKPNGIIKAKQKAEQGVEALSIVRDAFGRSGIRRSLFERFLPAYVQKADSYLQIVSNGTLSVVYDDGQMWMENRGKRMLMASFSGAEKRLFNAVFSMAMGTVLRERKTTFSQLFFDELLTAMDSYYIRQMLEFMKAMADLEGLGIFLTTNQESVISMGSYDAIFECRNDGGISTVTRVE